MMDPKYRDIFRFPPPPRPKKRPQPALPNVKPLPKPPPAPGLYITKKPEEADHTLCFVQTPDREKNIAILDGHKIVEHKQDADMTILVIDDEGVADICITREKCPPVMFDYV